MSKTLNLGEFVPVEIAQKLKEKGYPLLRVIKQRGEPIMYDLPKNHPNWQNCNAYYIPTISQVLKWLRDEKYIHIIIDFFTYIDTNKTYWYYSVKDIKDEVSYTNYMYKGKKSYENSALAGIEYVLDNLIQL